MTVRLPLDEAAITASSQNFHVDFVEEGAPLVITFGFYFATGTPQFEFLGRLRKLEQVSGRAINKLLVRDPSMRWYLGGIEGLGTDVPSTVAALREQIDALSPSAVITVGQSMGAYAAILYGTLLGADKAIPFGPLSCFDRRRWDILADRRWAPVLEKIESEGLDIAPWSDLPDLIARTEGKRPEIDLIFGSSPGPGTTLDAAIGHDAAHAVRFAGCDNVTILPVASSVHAVVEHFRSLGVITEVLDQRIFGASLLPTIHALHADSWVAWLLENITRGSTVDSLIPVMRQNMPEDQVTHFVGRFNLLTELARLQDHPPVFTA